MPFDAASTFGQKSVQMGAASLQDGVKMRKQGFAWIELLVVNAPIGIPAAILLPRGRAREAWRRVRIAVPRPLGRRERVLCKSSCRVHEALGGRHCAGRRQRISVLMDAGNGKSEKA
jgi:hypothetical protein